MLEAQYIERIFPGIVKNLAFKPVGRAADNFVTQASDLSASFFGGFQEYVNQLHSGFKEDFDSPSQLGLFRRLRPVLNEDPLILDEPASAAVVNTAVANAAAASFVDAAADV